MMKKFYYDFHIHSCLSPCGDNESTPNNIAGMASLCELDIVALTDHNTCKNCPAFFCAAEKYGIIPIAGMELTTSEDIHVVCLFASLEDAMRFGEYVSSHRILVENRPDIFGEQLILDENDEKIDEEKYLLPNATDISIEDIYPIVMSFGGVCYPAHIDRHSNSIMAILGTFPEHLPFGCFEIRDARNIEYYVENYALGNKIPIVSSDAHYLSDIRDGENYFEFDDGANENQVREALIKLLRGD